MLRTIERRETSLDTKLKHHKKTVKALKKSAANHRETVKSLKADLKKVRKMRKTVSSASPRQLALGLADLPVPACRWQALPEETRTQVLGLLARLLPAALWPRTRTPRRVSDDRAEVGGDAGAATGVGSFNLL